MQKHELSQYRAIAKEIKVLENRLNKLSMRKHKFGVDTVSASSRCKPYAKHSVLISGYGYDATNDGKKHKLIRDIKERLEALNIQFEAIQAFIRSIDDSEIRQIIEYRYIDGFSWQKIAFEMGEHDEQVPRRKHNKFLEKENLTKMTNLI